MAEYEVFVEGVVRLNIADEVFTAVDEDWRKKFYDLKTRAAIAEFLAMNIAVNHLDLSDIDGFADQPNSRVIVICNYFEPTSAEEVEPEE